MEETREESDDEDFQPAWQHLGQQQQQQQVLLPSESITSNLTRTLSFTAEGIGEAHTPSVLDPQPRQQDAEEDRKLPAQRAIDAPSQQQIQRAESFGAQFQLDQSSPSLHESLSASLQPELDSQQTFPEIAPDDESVARYYAAYAPPPPPVPSVEQDSSQVPLVPPFAAATAFGVSTEQSSGAEEPSAHVSKPAPHRKAQSAKHTRPKPSRRSPRVKSRSKMNGEDEEFQQLESIRAQRDLLAHEAEETDESPPVAASEPPLELQQQYRPSETEIAECRNDRKLKALNTFYERYNELAAYRETHGDCKVPQQYPPNKQLGVWVNKMRMERKKFDKDPSKSSLTEIRIHRLNNLGFDWGTNKGDAKWEEHFRALQQYREENGHCNVPTKYPQNPALGRYVSTQRCEFKKFQRGEQSLINQEKIDRLEALGFRWEMLNTS